MAATQVDIISIGPCVGKDSQSCARGGQFTMLIRARAPLRLGFAGGGTDLSPFCDQFGGAVLNATIDLYAYATLEPLAGSSVTFVSSDFGVKETFSADSEAMALGGRTLLHRAVYRRITRQFLDGRPFPCRLTTFCEAPPGSGLGSSSTMVVALVKAFVEALSLPLGEYDIARLAFEIERLDAGLEGGRQDQYAAAFGGFNFIEFFEQERVVVNPLRIKNWILSELEASLVLFYTGVSRSSSSIISEQRRHISSNTRRPMDALHRLKDDAFAMKEAVLKGDLRRFADILNRSWTAKKETAGGVSNESIERLFDVATQTGAIAGKVSGAGGGGFITFFVDPVSRINVVRRLSEEAGQVLTCSFTKRGTEGWRIER
jgi:D-glycero-alpha-D-manno-heptose-7-phosphate kinase